MDASLHKHEGLDRLYRFLSQRIVYHGLFWLALLLLMLWFNGIEEDLLFTLSNEIINLFFYAVIVYFNLLYLIPNYLTQKLFLTYCGLLILATVMVTPLKVLAMYWKFSNYPALQEVLLQNMNGYFVATFVVAASSTVFKIIADWVRDLREKQELQTQTMQSELRFLKSQINPHFLFNTLNNLYALTLKKSDQAPEIVLKLSEMMRYMLYECNEKQVLLSKEVNYIQNYLGLEQLRQGKNVDIRFAVEGQVKDQKIAPLMFIPFLENSFKHGLSNHITSGFVNIKLEVHDEDDIEFFIENSKPDTPPRPDNRRSGGIGLANIRRRLKLLYPGQYELDIQDTPRVYSVRLKLKLEH